MEFAKEAPPQDPKLKLQVFIKPVANCGQMMLINTLGRKMAPTSEQCPGGFEPREVLACATMPLYASKSAAKGKPFPYAYLADAKTQSVAVVDPSGNTLTYKSVPADVQAIRNGVVASDTTTSAPAPAPAPAPAAAPAAGDGGGQSPQ